MYFLILLRVPAGAEGRRAWAAALEPRYDDELVEAVRRKLAEVEAVARRQGYVVAIGHPHEATLQALKEWLPTVQGKGLALAPATAVLRKRNGWD